MTAEFVAFPKIPRLFREIVISEKIDGTNACVVVTDDGGVFAQSRKRLITPAADNFGFARWVAEREDELRELGPGHHFGEWYGQGIQRGYGLDEKRFALFNVDRYEERPACCGIVQVLFRDVFAETAVNQALALLADRGSVTVPGFMHPEGVVVFHRASGHVFKVLLEGDDEPKGLAA